MTISFQERPGTRRSTSSPPTFELEYVCEGVFDSGSVKAMALSLTPPLVATTEGILFRSNIDVREYSYCVYYVAVQYTKKQDEVGAYQFSFQTTGGSLHITHSRESVAKYPGLARSHNQAIDVDKENRPRGTTVTVPACRLSYTFKHPAGVINELTAIALARVTGMVNNAAWHGLQAGEALFLGADGSDGTDSDAEATYHVAAEENLTGLVIGAISGIAKQGHDLLWVWWEDNVEGNAPGVKPRGVYVERLYRRTNFTTALGF